MDNQQNSFIGLRNIFFCLCGQKVGETDMAQMISNSVPQALKSKIYIKYSQIFVRQIIATLTHLKHKQKYLF